MSSSAPSYDCRASTSDDDDREDYEPLTAEELNEKINRHAERRLLKERERLGPLLTNPNDPRPWETAGGTVKGGGKWGKGKGKDNRRPKRIIWNERRKEWLLNLPVCSGPHATIRSAPRWAINVKSRCAYLKHLPTYVGDTMERQFASGDQDLEALLRQWQPRQMRDRNWTSANYYWWRIQKRTERTQQILQAVAS